MIIKTSSYTLTKTELITMKKAFYYSMCLLCVCMSVRDVSTEVCWRVLWVFCDFFFFWGGALRDKTYAFIFMRLKICPTVNVV